MRNCWLAAIAGHQGNAPSNISSEGLTGAEVPERSEGRATEHVGRGTRARRGLVGQRAEAPIEGRGADGSRVGRPRRSPAPRPDPVPRKHADPQATTSATQQHVVSYAPASAT